MAHWQKEIPAADGRYWVATQDGLSAGLATVVRHPDGRLLIAGHTPGVIWGGWWYSEPVREPPAPPAEMWDQARVFQWADAGYGSHIAIGDETGRWQSKPEVRCAPVAESLRCKVPPEGWSCSRASGHEGPCAASPTSPGAKTAAAIVKTFT